MATKPCLAEGCSLPRCGRSGWCLPHFREWLASPHPRTWEEFLNNPDPVPYLRPPYVLTDKEIEAFFEEEEA